jgi:hypothetical protein
MRVTVYFPCGGQSLSVVHTDTNIAALGTRELADLGGVGASELAELAAPRAIGLSYAELVLGGGAGALAGQSGRAPCKGLHFEAGSGIEGGAGWPDRDIAVVRWRRSLGVLALPTTRSHRQQIVHAVILSNLDIEYLNIILQMAISFVSAVDGYGQGETVALHVTAKFDPTP